MNPGPVEAAEGGRALVRSEERLRVTTRRRPTEVVRVSKRVVTEERTITVPVRREELVVERSPAGEGPGPVPSPGRPDRPVEHVLILSEEEVVVETRMVPKERVRVWVETTTEHRTVQEVLRKENIDVAASSTDTSRTG